MAAVSITKANVTLGIDGDVASCNNVLTAEIRADLGASDGGRSIDVGIDNRAVQKHCAGDGAGVDCSNHRAAGGRLDYFPIGAVPDF